MTQLKCTFSKLQSSKREYEMMEIAEEELAWEFLDYSFTPVSRLKLMSRTKIVLDIS